MNTKPEMYFPFSGVSWGEWDQRVNSDICRKTALRGYLSRCELCCHLQCFSGAKNVRAFFVHFGIEGNVLRLVRTMDF